MNDASILLKRCRAKGVVFKPRDDRLIVEAEQPLPAELIEELHRHKEQILAELSWERRSAHECWLLEEWRRVSIPAWRRILRESREKNDKGREEYARWMLKEMLQDPEYCEVKGND